MLGVWSLGGPDLARQPLLAKRRDTSFPGGVAILQHRDSIRRRAGPDDVVKAEVARAKVVGDAAFEDRAGDVADSPGDRGKGRRVRGRRCLFVAEAAIADRADRPAAGDRLPEVLLVRQPLQAPADREVPVKIELRCQLSLPVDRHVASSPVNVGPTGFLLVSRASRSTSPDRSRYTGRMELR